MTHSASMCGSSTHVQSELPATYRTELGSIGGRLAGSGGEGEDDSEDRVSV